MFTSHAPTVNPFQDNLPCRKAGLLRGVAGGVEGDEVEGGVELLEAVGVGAGVVAELEAAVDADAFVAPINVGDINGDVSAAGDGVVARFPLVDSLAGPFGADRQMEGFVAGIHLVDNAEDGLLRAAAVNREAPHSAQQGSHREKEGLFFYHHPEMPSDSPIVQISNEKVPYTGVRCFEENAIFFFDHITHKFPLEGLEYKSAEP